MTFDCEQELYKLRNYPTNLLLRLTVDDSKSICRFNSKYGCIIDDVSPILILSKQLQLNVIGFSFHVGSGCLSSDSYYDALKLCRKATDIAFNLGIKVSMIDIGGGFPGDNKKIDFKTITEKINKGMYDFFGDLTIDFIAEPGRFFSHKTHTLVVSIIGKKIKDTRIYYINDSIYNSFNCIIFDHAKPLLISFKEGELFKSKVFGATCDSMDIISEEIFLPDLEVGDKLYVEYFGAYTIAAASGFNGIPKPINYYINE
jgi:ornithine decarboxylase